MFFCYLVLLICLPFQNQVCFAIYVQSRSAEAVRYYEMIINISATG